MRNTKVKRSSILLSQIHLSWRTWNKSTHLQGFYLWGSGGSCFIPLISEQPQSPQSPPSILFVPDRKRCHQDWCAAMFLRLWVFCASQVSQMREIMHIKFTESHIMFRNKSIAKEDSRANRLKSLPFTLQAQEFVSPVKYKVSSWHQVKKNKTKCVLKSKS